MVGLGGSDGLGGTGGLAAVNDEAVPLVASFTTSSSDSYTTVVEGAGGVASRTAGGVGECVDGVDAAPKQDVTLHVH